MTFDPRTVGLMIVMLTFISAGMLALVQRQARSIQGVGWWALAELLVGIGLFLTLMQLFISPWLSFVLGNTLLLAGLGLTWYGIKIYKNEAPPTKLIAGIVVFTALIGWWFGIMNPQPAIRIAILSFLYALLAGLAASSLLVKVAQPLRTAYWITGGAFGVYALAMLARGLVIGVIEQDITAFEPTPINMLTFVVGASTQLVTTFGLVLMITYRMSMNMERLASIDALTGALNRRSLEQGATSLAAQGTGRSIGVIMLDIDHFKLVNDRYGHPAGDYVLQEVTTLARAQLRDRDLFARMGGEEFCVVLAEGDEDRAARIAERIREVCSHEAMNFNGVAIQVHLSAGVAASRVSGGALEDLIGEADLALYNAKQTGRDKVVRWSEIAAHSRPTPAQRIALPEALSRIA